MSDSTAGVYRLSFKGNSAVYIDGAADVHETIKRHEDQAAIYGAECTGEVLTTCTLDKLWEETNQAVSAAKFLRIELTAEPQLLPYLAEPAKLTPVEPEPEPVEEDRELGEVLGHWSDNGSDWDAFDIDTFRERFGVMSPKGVLTALRKRLYKGVWVVPEVPAEDYPNPEFVYRPHNPLLYDGQWFYKTTRLGKELGLKPGALARAIYKGEHDGKPITKLQIFPD